MERHQMTSDQQTETLEALIQMRLKYISIGTCKNKK